MPTDPEKKPIFQVLKGIHLPKLPGHNKDDGSSTDQADTPPHFTMERAQSLQRTQSRTRKRRYSTNSIGGQRGTLHTTHGALHGDLTFRDRIHHFTLAWFTSTMSTGGIALLLARTPHRFPGLNIIGDIFFILTVILFLVYCTLITIRFTLFPKSLAKCVTHPTESLFFPTFWITICNIISNCQEYAVPHCGVWLVVTLRVVFWLYTALTFWVSVAQYFFLFTGKPLTIQSMTPQWILPVFPIMLSGTLASLLASSQPVHHAYPMIIGGLTFQGLGMLMAIFMYGPYLRRLMTAGLPTPNTRPGMFIAVGPPSFTGLALLGLSAQTPRIYPSYATFSSISNPSLIPDIFRVFAIGTTLFLWAVALWFFSIALVSVLAGAFFKTKEGKKGGMSFHLTWWAFVFPNVGFAIVTCELGDVLMSEGVKWVGTAMTVGLVVVWVGVAVCHVRAVVRRQILWPGKDEDHDQGGFIEEMEGRFER